MSDWLKVAPDEVVATMSVCNEGGATEAIKHFLGVDINPEEMPQGNIVEQFVMVANNAKNKKVSEGILVDTAAKSGDTIELVRDICDVIKDLATQSISESAVVCLESGNEEIFNIIQDANSEFTKNVIEFLHMIPQMTKQSFMELSADINGKMEYVGLINCAILASTGIFLLYKLIDTAEDKKAKDKDKAEEDQVAEDLKKVAESRNALMGAAVCVKNSLITLMENKEVSYDVYSSFIENAVKLLTEIVSNKEIANSPYIGLLEVLIARLAAPYDEYMQDVAQIVTGGAIDNKETEDESDKKPAKKKAKKEKEADIEGDLIEPRPEEPEVPTEEPKKEEVEEKPKKKRGRPKKSESKPEVEGGEAEIPEQVQ